MDVTDLIGIPFEYSARGPDKYDCYGLIRLLLKEWNGIEVPDYQGYSDTRKIIAAFHNALPLWEKVPVQPAGILLFRVPGQMHVGYVLDDNRTFVHTWEHSGGVCIERISDWQNRLIGCYKYVGQ